jgi:hypothetical protein
MAVAASSELATIEGLASLEHPVCESMTGKKPGGAVLDQTGSGSGPYRRLIQSFEDLAVNPRADQHIGGEQTRGSSANDPNRDHARQCATATPTVRSHLVCASERMETAATRAGEEPERITATADRQLCAW